MTFRRAASLMVLLTLSTCDADSDDGGCEASDDPASVTVDNRTGGTVEAITATPCDGGQEVELPLPEAGLAFSDQVTLELPAAGCWLLHWNGSGCTNDPAYRTDDVCGGENHAWTLTVDGRVCEGGW